MITSKIKAIKSVKLYDKGKHGPIWYFTLEMENSDIINLGKKYETAFQLGDEVQYVVESEEYGVKKVRHPKPDEFSQETRTSATTSIQTTSDGVTITKNFPQNLISFAASYSKDLVVAGKVDITAMEQTAEQIYNWMASKI